MNPKNNPVNRKTATGMLLINWARYQCVTFRLEGSTLIAGENTSGKSMILDAMTYCLTGNTQFNKAAGDRDRTVRGYVRGDTHAEGRDQFLRSGPVISYVAMEFYAPDEEQYLVTGVAIESPDETRAESRWFLFRNTRLSDLSFAKVEKGRLLITPPRLLVTPNGPVRPEDLRGRDQGVRQTLLALGIRADPARYREKLTKMIAFHPENNVDRFIRDCVLDEGNTKSLTSLREQKEALDRLKKTYDTLRGSRDALAAANRIAEEYEKKQRQLSIRELMLCWQNHEAAEGRKQELELRKARKEVQLQAMENDQRRMEQVWKDAQARLQAIEHEADFEDLTRQLKELEHMIREAEEERKRRETETAALLRLQTLLSGKLSFLTAELQDYPDQLQVLQSLGTTEFPATRRRDAFVFLSRRKEETENAMREEKVHLTEILKQEDGELAALESKLRDLEAHRVVLPEDVTLAKTRLLEALAARGIQTEIRTLAELVEELTDESWRQAVEGLLDARRYDLLVEEKYCADAVQLWTESRIQGTRLVRTDCLEALEIQKGTAAGLLKIPSPAARKYMDLLLGKIRLYDSPEALREDTADGITRDGVLMIHRAVEKLDFSKLDVCLGEKALEIQQERVRKKKAEVLAARAIHMARRDTLEQRLASFKDEEWDPAGYAFEAPERLGELENELNLLRRQDQRIRNNPDFTTRLELYEEAKRHEQKTRQDLDALIGDQRLAEKALEETEQDLSANAAERFTARETWERESLKHFEIVDVMKQEYQALRDKIGETIVIREKGIYQLRTALEEISRRLENAQLEYLKISEQDLNMRGVAFISVFRKEYQNLANVQIEKARAQLEEKANLLEQTFLTDFVAEINENIQRAKEDLDQLNRELKEIPFGRDVYRFVMKERKDREAFFRISHRLMEYVNMPGLYMMSGQGDEEMLHDIRTFLQVILEEEDETEYTDYRKYFHFDMQILSRQGSEETVSELSRKQGSASGGEKQTPYYIILAAALMQFYPRNRCCARLAFMDEAFSAMSPDRVEQMIRYFENNHFQVIYAAPPQKINEIGSHIASTVSLFVNGKYTVAVDGTVRRETDPSRADGQIPEKKLFGNESFPQITED